MTDSDALLKNAGEGFGTLTVSKKYIESAVYWLKIWLTDKAFKDIGFIGPVIHILNNSF